MQRACRVRPWLGLARARRGLSRLEESRTEGNVTLSCGQVVVVDDHLSTSCAPMDDWVIGPFAWNASRIQRGRPGGATLDLL
jgi:hypothetical protein